MSKDVHCPVMLPEVIEYLVPQPGGIYLDMTVGAGGHARAIADKIGGDGYLVGIDRDQEILPFAEENLAAGAAAYSLHQSVFSNVGEVLARLAISRINGVLFDLGISSYQLAAGRRGFSFSHEGPLDMRMGSSGSLTAAEIVNSYSEAELAQLFFEFGEESNARRFSREIVKARRHKTIQSTLELAALITRCLPYKGGRLHPATKVFQALRIAVNDELGQLRQGLEAIIPYLKPGGRLVVISFHSLEDRIVKHFFRDRPELQFLTKSPVIPGADEKRRNPRSRSAKLRCALKE